MSDTPSLLRWSANEHRHFERGADWYWALGVVALATSATAILFGNVLFGLLIIVAAITMGLLARVPPRNLTFELSEHGILVGDTLHEYKEILSFWVIEEGDESLLLIDTPQFMMPNLIIPIQGVDPRSVREFLVEHVHEVPMKEPVSHKILEFFGF